MNDALIETEILACERRRCDALLSGDAAALEDLLSERLIFFHANATRDDKRSLLAKMAAGTVVYRSLSVDETVVTPLPEAVLLSGRLMAEVTVAGVEKSIRNRTLSVWERVDGSWKLLAYQPTPMPA